MAEDKRTDPNIVNSYLLTTANNFAKGAACLELIPGRRYALMTTKDYRNFWEFWNVQVARRLPAVKPLENHAKDLGYINTYAMPVTLIVDVARFAHSFYKDELTFGPNVVKTSTAIGGGWVGGYLGSMIGYKVGEYVGHLFDNEGFVALALGYIGGTMGAGYGDKMARTIFLENSQ